VTEKETIAFLNDEDRVKDQPNGTGGPQRDAKRKGRKGSGADRGMKRRVFEVDLSELQGEGDFPCPNCGVIISPDDESEETYTILETKGDEDLLEEVVLRCKKCESIVRLKGFEKLEEAELKRRVEISEPQASSQPGSRTVHIVSLDGNQVGRLVIEYLHEEDVKAFSKINRDLKVGDPFQIRLFIDSSSGVTADGLVSEGLEDIVKVIKRRAKGLRERDIFLVAVEGGRERLIGRAENLIQGSPNEI